MTQKYKCEFCKKDIKDKDEIAVLSYPIRSYGGGSYQLNDFLRNERILHFECLEKVKLGRFDVESAKVVLKELEKIGFTGVDIKVVESLMSKLKSNDIEYIVAEYIKNSA